MLFKLTARFYLNLYVGDGEGLIRQVRVGPGFQCQMDIVEYSWINSTNGKT